MHYNLHSLCGPLLASTDDSQQANEWDGEQYFNHDSAPSITKSNFADFESLVEKSGSGIVFIAMEG
jgi:hypothetical protein